MTENIAAPVYGASFEDLAAFLQRSEPGGYPVDVVRECVCRACGGRRFEVRVMAAPGSVRRTCLDCGHHEFIADSEEYWEESETHYYCACLCREEQFAAAIGYAMREEGDDVRWIFVGLRCLACGRLGVYEDWKISWGPSGHLLDQA